MEHPCKGRCGEYKQEACATCLIDQKPQVIQLESLSDQVQRKTIGQAIDQCFIEVFGVANH